jgi:hypothetical protein
MSGIRRVLVLEDDVYFDAPKLRRAVGACLEFLKADLDFSAFLFGGVYTEMQATSISGVFSGKGVQAHCWLINVRHPVWNAAANSGFRMADMYNHERGLTYMIHPGVAFQRDFSRGETAKSRPVYNLEEFPPLYRTLTELGMRFGMRNCWEGCARKTNSLVYKTGSIKAAVISLGVVVGVLLSVIVTMACCWATWAQKK